MKWRHVKLLVLGGSPFTGQNHRDRFRLWVLLASKELTLNYQTKKGPELVVSLDQQETQVWRWNWRRGQKQEGRGEWIKFVAAASSPRRLWNESKWRHCLPRFPTPLPSLVLRVAKEAASVAEATAASAGLRLGMNKYLWFNVKSYRPILEKQ